HRHPHPAVAASGQPAHLHLRLARLLRRAAGRGGGRADRRLLADPPDQPAAGRPVPAGRCLLVRRRLELARGPRLRSRRAPGRRRRLPLLLINGIGASLEALEPFVTALNPAVEVIRFDPPGVGGSPLPPGPYRFTGLCRLIARMLTELGYDRVDVLGISWGG